MEPPASSTASDAISDTTAPPIQPGISQEDLEYSLTLVSGIHEFLSDNFYETSKTEFKLSEIKEKFMKFHEKYLAIACSAMVFHAILEMDARSRVTIYKLVKPLPPPSESDCDEEEEEEEEELPTKENIPLQSKRKREETSTSNDKKVRRRKRKAPDADSSSPKSSAVYVDPTPPMRWKMTITDIGLLPQEVTQSTSSAYDGLDEEILFQIGAAAKDGDNEQEFVETISTEFSLSKEDVNRYLNKLCALNKIMLIDNTLFTV